MVGFKTMMASRHGDQRVRHGQNTVGRGRCSSSSNMSGAALEPDIFSMTAHSALYWVTSSPLRVAKYVGVYSPAVSAN